MAAPADRRWDEKCVIYLAQISRGLRPKEWEKKLVDLLDPTFALAPPCASERRVSVDIAGRKMYSAVKLGGDHRIKARVGDIVTHLAARNGCSARTVTALLDRCRVDGRAENADGETVLDVALNLERRDVAAAVDAWLRAARTDGEPEGSPSRSRKMPAFFAGSHEAHHAGGGRPASASGGGGLTRPPSSQGFGWGHGRARDAPRPRSARSATRRFVAPAPESPFHFADAAHGRTVVSEDGLGVENVGDTWDVDHWACDTLDPCLTPDVAKATLTLKIKAANGAHKSDGVYIGVGTSRAFDAADGMGAVSAASSFGFRCRDGRVFSGGAWVPGFSDAGEACADKVAGFYHDGDKISLEYDRDARSLTVRDDRGLSRELQCPGNPFNFAST